jgi:hypothetical protein
LNCGLSLLTFAFCFLTFLCGFAALRYPLNRRALASHFPVGRGGIISLVSRQFVAAKVAAAPIKGIDRKGPISGGATLTPH